MAYTNIWQEPETPDVPFSSSSADLTYPETPLDTDFTDLQTANPTADGGDLLEFVTPLGKTWTAQIYGTNTIRNIQVDSIEYADRTVAVPGDFKPGYVIKTLDDGNTWATNSNSSSWVEAESGTSGGGLSQTQVDARIASQTTRQLADYSEIASAPTTPMHISVGGLRGGEFEWTVGDYSAQVTADTMAGKYVPPSSDLTGGTGVWIRTSRLTPKSFGAVQDYTNEDGAFINEVLKYADLDMDGERYYISSVIDIPTGRKLCNGRIDFKIVSTAHFVNMSTSSICEDIDFVGVETETTFKASAWGTDSDRAAIRTLSGAKHAIVSGCKFYAVSFGVILDTAQNCTVTNSYIDGLVTATAIPGDPEQHTGTVGWQHHSLVKTVGSGTAHKFTELDGRNVGSILNLAGNPNNYHISGIYAENWMDHVVYIGEGSGHTVTNVEGVNGASSVFQLRGWDHVISNVVGNNIQSLISIQAQSGALRDGYEGGNIVVSDCTAKDVKGIATRIGRGFDVSDVFGDVIDVSFNNCNVFGCNEYATPARLIGDNISISGKFRDCLNAAGIAIGVNSNRCKVHDSVFENFSSIGVSNAGTSSVIHNNEFIACANDAINGGGNLLYFHNNNSDVGGYTPTGTYEEHHNRLAGEYISDPLASPFITETAYQALAEKNPNHAYFRHEIGFTAVSPTPSTAAAIRNNYAGVVGYEFSIAQPLPIEGFGRLIGSIFNDPHTITLWRVADTSPVASVNVSPASDEIDGYAVSYFDPMTLAADTYRLVVSETNGGDNWINSSAIVANGLLSITGSVSGTAGYPTSLSAVANTAFAHVNIYGSIVNRISFGKSTTDILERLNVLSDNRPIWIFTTTTARDGITGIFDGMRAIDLENDLIHIYNEGTTTWDLYTGGFTDQNRYAVLAGDVPVQGVGSAQEYLQGKGIFGVTYYSGTEV